MTKSKPECFLNCFVGIWLMDIGTQILKKITQITQIKKNIFRLGHAC